MSEFCANYGTYDSFKNDLIDKTRCFPKELIRKVVNEYEDVIDSKRRSSCIKNVQDLILILEKRCHISPEDYSQLQIIVNYLPKKDKQIMIARINHHTTSGNDYSNLNGISNSEHPLTQSRSESNAVLPEKVITLISNEIGVKWRDLARKLDIREGCIMNIEKKYPQDYRRCAYESLLLYQCRSMKHNLRRNLLEALINARRKDLQLDVQEIFDQME